MRFLVALTLVLVVAGCGVTKKKSDSKFKGDKAAVAATFATLGKAAKAQDQAKICNELLSTRLAGTLGGRAHCKDTISNVLDDADPTAAKVTVKTVTLGPGRSPTTATATVTSGSGDQLVRGTLPLVKQGKTWRIDGFG